MWYWMHDLGAGGWGSMFVMMTIVWLPLLLAVAWFARRLDGRTGLAPTTSNEDATAVAQRRYAGGEITREQYLQIVDDLGRPRKS